MATQGYDPNKAQAYNQWLQNNPGQPVGETLAQQFARIRAEKAAAGIPQGSEGSAQYAALKAQQREERQQQAKEAAGITDAEAGNYAIGTNGQMGALVIGNDRFETPSPDFENDTIKQVAYPEKASSPVSSKTPINYTTTSTETVSGGGSTTIYAGTRSQTPRSEAFAAAAVAKDEELAQLNQDNPSNFVRKRQGLPLLTPDEEIARAAKVKELKDQRTQLRQSQQDSESTTPGSTVTVPNTTTTTQTVTSETTAVNTPVETLDGADPALNQQTEIQLGTTSNPIRATATSPLPADGDEALAAEQAEQEIIDLRIAAESATPVDSVTEGLLLEQEQLRQFQADEELSARLDRAADVPLTDEDAALQAQELADLRIAAESASPVDTDPDGLLAQQEAIRQAQDAADLNTALTFEAAPVPLSALNESEFSAPEPQNSDGVNAGAAVTRGLTNNAQNQSTLQTRQNTPAAADWRVRLRLAPNANYLYKVPAGNGGPGILAPLAATDGVVFPYTPAIETSYQAKYASYDLTHSNYRGYFYQNSSIENITIKGTFTAQDTREAAYLLAVIHFFKSVTKMFYGQDAEAGTPPPLVYLSGFGKYQFNESPCVVTNFGYSLPTDVDYIRANGFNNIGLNMENRRNQSSGPAIGGSLGTVVAILDRLNNAGLSNGSLTNRPSPSQVNQNVTNQTSINSTYVPTKMEISITLLPMQTRNQVSKQFSLKSFANGSLLAGGGFW
jgi:hypothetical protein